MNFSKKDDLRGGPFEFTTKFFLCPLLYAMFSFLLTLFLPGLLVVSRSCLHLASLTESFASVSSIPSVDRFVVNDDLSGISQILRAMLIHSHVSPSGSMARSSYSARRSNWFAQPVHDMR